MTDAIIDGLDAYATGAEAAGAHEEAGNIRPGIREIERLRTALQQAEEGAAIIVGQISAPEDGLSPGTTAWVIRQAMGISNRARAALSNSETDQTHVQSPAPAGRRDGRE